MENERKDEKLDCKIIPISRARIDPEKLKKGTIISPEELKSLYNLDYPITWEGKKPQYWQWVMGLVSRIERDMCMQGFPVVVCQKDNAVKILTDAEASEYLMRRSDEGTVTILNAHRKMSRVDVSALDEEEMTRHTRRQYVVEKRADDVLKTNQRLGVNISNLKLAMARRDENRDE